MNNVYIHSHNDEKKYICFIMLLLFPFILYSIYKNGYLLYKHHLITIIGIFKPLVMLVLAVICSFILTRIKKKDFISYELLLNVLFVVVTPPSTKLWLFSIFLFVLNALYIFKKYHLVSLGMSLISILLLLLKRLSFENIFEKTIKHSYTLIDYLLGKGPGGLCNTLLIMSVISLIVLSFKYNYKRQIPLLGFSVYYVLSLITFIICGKFDYDIFLNNNVIFAFIFLAPISLFSPYTRGGCYIYALLLGILCYLSSFINVNVGVYIVIFALSLLSPIFDKIIVKRRKAR